jgi:ankyrin repeat protein
MVALLLKYKADPNLKVWDGSPPLIAACTEELHRASQMEPGMVLALLKAGADVNGTDADGDTALISSCYYTNEVYRGKISQIVACLLSAGANVNATNFEGKTALMMAAAGAHPDLVRQLLARGAEPALLAKNGEIAVDFALIGQEANRLDEAIARLKTMDEAEREEALKRVNYESNNLQEVVGLLRKVP